MCGTQQPNSMSAGCAHHTGTTQTPRPMRQAGGERVDQTWHTRTHALTLLWQQTHVHSCGTGNVDLLYILHSHHTWLLCLSSRLNLGLLVCHTTTLSTTSTASTLTTSISHCCPTTLTITTTTTLTITTTCLSCDESLADWLVLLPVGALACSCVLACCSTRTLTLPRVLGAHMLPQRRQQQQAQLRQWHPAAQAASVTAPAPAQALQQVLLRVARMQHGEQANVRMLAGLFIGLPMTCRGVVEGVGANGIAALQQRLAGRHSAPDQPDTEHAQAGAWC